MMQTEKLSTALTLKEQGNVFVKEKRYKEALQKYEEAIQLDPLLAAGWLNKGMMHANLQEYSKAVSAFEQALKIDPNYTKAKSKHKAIQCYLEEKYTEAIEADPNFAPAWLAKGILHKKHKQYAEALDAFEKALALVPDYSEAKSNKIEVLLVQEQYDKVIAIDAHNSLAWLGKGLEHKKLEQYEQAMTALTKAGELNPALSRNVEFNQALILMAQKKYLQAWPLLSTLSSYPNPDIQAIKAMYECSAQIQAKVVFACADLKFTADNKIKILEFGSGMKSGFEGLRYATDNDIIKELFKKIEELSLPPLFLNSEPGCDVVDHDYIKCVLSDLPPSDKKFSPENLLSYRAIYGGSEVRPLKEEESILIMDDATVNTIFEDKVLTHQAFVETNLEEYRPKTIILERKLHPDLAQQIRQSIPGSRFVLKSPDEEGGQGVIVIENKDLEVALQCLIHKENDFITDPSLQEKINSRIKSLLTPLEYSKKRIEEMQLIADKWIRSNNDYFLVEEYVDSKPVFYKDDFYDATMRVAFIFIRDKAEITCEPFACYWKIPPAPIKSAQSLREKTVSSYSADRHDAACVNKEDEKKVYQQLKVALPSVINSMIKKNLLSYIQIQPPESYHQLLEHFATSLAYQGQFILAHHYLQEVEKLQPSGGRVDWHRWKACHHRGVFYHIEGKYDKALGCFGQALEIDPNEITFYRRAKTWLALGNRVKAKADFMMAPQYWHKAAAQMFFQEEQQREKSADTRSRLKPC